MQAPHARQREQSNSDLLQQARQGSVAAIIQFLNEALASTSIRTRAVLANRVLQLLCEADHADQLEPEVVVPVVKETLESVAPSNIRAVKIYGRLMQEQQLLWLEAIQRDPEHEVLWSTQVKLSHPSFFERLRHDRPVNKKNEIDLKAYKKRSKPLGFSVQLLLGVLLGSGLLGLGILLGQRLLPSSADSASQRTEETRATVAPEAQVVDATDAGLNTDIDAADAVASPVPESDEPAAIQPAAIQQADPFARAVWLAEQAVSDGQTATTSRDWLTAAARWQEAADFMAQVPERDPRYQTAQNRVIDYQENSQIAIAEAQALNRSSSESAD